MTELEYQKVRVILQEPTMLDKIRDVLWSKEEDVPREVGCSECEKIKRILGFEEN